MRLLRFTVLATATLALAAPAEAAVGTTQHAINVTLLHEKTLGRQAARAQSDAQQIRDRAAQCRDAFAAAPAAAKRDLRRVYRDAIAGALWLTDRQSAAGWIRRLKPAAGSIPAWRGARTHLRTAFATADRTYRLGVDDPCEVVEAWQSNGFDPSAPPEEVTQLRGRRTPAATPAPRAIHTLLRGLGTTSARRALAALDRGVAEPAAKVIHRGDVVWAALK